MATATNGDTVQWNSLLLLLCFLMTEQPIFMLHIILQIRVILMAHCSISFSLCLCVRAVLRRSLSLAPFSFLSLYLVHIVFSPLGDYYYGEHKKNYDFNNANLKASSKWNGRKSDKTMTRFRLDFANPHFNLQHYQITLVSFFSVSSTCIWINLSERNSLWLNDRREKERHKRQKKCQRS